MIKTLRITSVSVLAIFAVGLFAFLVFSGFRGDAEIEKFLNSPTAIDRFKQRRGTEAGTSEQTPPLVAQAGLFARFLNPPAPKETSRTVDGGPTNTGGPAPPPPTPRSSPKFPVVATCVNHSRPEQSWALIDEPGKGRHWVRQTSKIGHLTIEQVKDGQAVIKSGKGTYELSVQRNPQLNLLLDPLAPLTGSKPISGLDSSQVDTVAGEPVAVAADRGTAPEVPASPEDQMSAEEQAAMVEKIFGELEALARTSSDKIASGPGGREGAAEAGDGVSGPEATRITGKEARKLDHLGREMKDYRHRTDRAKLRQDMQKRRKMLRDRARKAGTPARPKRPDNQ
jgi:hypothetical protein